MKLLQQRRIAIFLLSFWKLIITPSSEAFVAQQPRQAFSPMVSSSNRVASTIATPAGSSSAAQLAHTTALRRTPSSSFYSTALSVKKTSLTTNDEDTDGFKLPSFLSTPFSLGFAASWLVLVVIAFSKDLAPGALDSPHDAAMLQEIIANPLHPENVNELYYTVFNIFGPLPLILASLILPQASCATNKKLPAGPFVAASAAVGYFAIGLYMALRGPPLNVVEKEEPSAPQIGWFTRNVTENKLVGWFLVAFCLYLPFGAHFFEAWQQDPAATWQGFIHVLSTSRFASISCLDLSLLYITCTILTVTDYQLRKPINAEDEGEATKVALASALLPFLGSALYVALRPPLLPALENEEE